MVRNCAACKDQMTSFFPIPNNYWLTQNRILVQSFANAFHPQTYGQTERCVAVLDDMLRHYEGADHTLRDESLPQVKSLRGMPMDRTSNWW